MFIALLFLVLYDIADILALNAQQENVAISIKGIVFYKSNSKRDAYCRKMNGDKLEGILDDAAA